MSKAIRQLKPTLLGLLLVSFLVSGRLVNSQHEGHVMKKAPAASKPKAKSAPSKKKPRPKPRRTATKKPAPSTPSASPSPSRSPSPPHEMMPGMQMPAVSPSPSPRHEMMPGMQMPSASPHPHASPEKKMDTPTPMASPSPQSSHDHKMTTPMPAANPSPGAMGETKSSAGSMSMGPLMVMSGDEMGIRVGSSDQNIMWMGQMGSGTAWQPASSPMYMTHKTKSDWLFMFHYNVVAGVNSQGGPRGVTKIESANWFMPMAYHKLGKGTVQLRGMFSFEPFTFPPGGSPLLFQTGETYKGQPIIDKQHPHDLFMELSAQYTHPLGERATWFTYFGYPGEPALGPTAFMHRMSASENSSATLSHHLQDSSHITFGVFTTGFTYRWFKLEGSIFNGREPGENRYNFEAHPWTSRSVRLSFAPHRNWSMQVSHGLLRNPEALEPGDVRRSTASITYNRAFDRGNWATSLIWGRNHESHSGEIFNLNGYVVESTVNFLDKNYLYGRLELVDKNQLLRAVDRQLLGIADHHPSFRIGAYTFGGVRDIWNNDKVSLGIGSDLTFYSKPAILDRIYGDNPVSWKLFLRLRPGKMTMASAHGTHGNVEEK